MEMKKETLVKICRDGGFYRSPELNDVLYFHYKGFCNIDEIDEYVNAKCVWLEGNAIEKIENLEKLVNMRQLYLQENCLRKIEGLSRLPGLVSLNLSDNFIKKVEGLEELKNLKTLHLKNNKLKSIDDVIHLTTLPSLETLDLTGNHIEDPEVLDVVFAQIPNLLSLYTHQNPFCKKIQSYRKISIGKCKKLRYFDDRPVFPDERRCVDAFMTGGIDSERAERQEINQEEAERNERNRLAFKELIAEAKREKAELEKKGLEKPPNTVFHVDNYMREPTEEDKWYTAQRALNAKKPEEKEKEEPKNEPPKETHADPMACALVSDEDSTEEHHNPPSDTDQDPPIVVHSKHCAKDPPQQQPGRPMVWGTPAYDTLWKKAVAASQAEDYEIEELD